MYSRRACPQPDTPFACRLLPGHRATCGRGLAGLLSDTARRSSSTSSRHRSAWRAPVFRFIRLVRSPAWYTSACRTVHGVRGGNPARRPQRVHGIQCHLVVGAEHASKAELLRVQQPDVRAHGVMCARTDSLAPVGSLGGRPPFLSCGWEQIHRPPGRLSTDGRTREEVTLAWPADQIQRQSADAPSIVVAAAGAAPNWGVPVPIRTTGRTSSSVMDGSGVGPVCRTRRLLPAEGTASARRRVRALSARCPSLVQKHCARAVPTARTKGTTISK